MNRRDGTAIIKGHRHCRLNWDGIPDFTISTWPRSCRAERGIGIVIRFRKHWVHYCENPAYFRGLVDAYEASHDEIIKAYKSSLDSYAAVSDMSDRVVDALNNGFDHAVRGGYLALELAYMCVDASAQKQLLPILKREWEKASPIAYDWMRSPEELELLVARLKGAT